MDEQTQITDVVVVTLETVEAVRVCVVRVWTRALHVVARAVADTQTSVVRLARPPTGGAWTDVTFMRPARAGRSCVQEA